MSVKAVRATVTGRVQGVSFRAWARDEAAARGLSGWVRNEPDGSVTARIEGPPAAVDAMVAALGRGPAAARVDRVETQAADPSGAAGFEVRR